nr:MAG TPA: hypothetical protein [Caudoviricetes sp.]
MKGSVYYDTRIINSRNVYYTMVRADRFALSLNPSKGLMLLLHYTLIYREI